MGFARGDRDPVPPGVRMRHVRRSRRCARVTLHVHGFGHAHPSQEITNRFLEELDIGTDDAWILERVGIRSRRTVLPLDYIRTTRNQDVRAANEAAEISNAGMAARAARMAIERAGIETSRIGLVIAGSSATDTHSPAEA